MERKKLTKKNIFVMMFLTIVTLGFYMPVWFIKRKLIFNQLNQGHNATDGLAIAMIVSLILSLIPLVLSVMSTDQLMIEMLGLIQNIFILVMWVFQWILSFQLRGALIARFQHPVSVFGLICCGFVGVQHAVNHILDKQQRIEQGETDQ